MSSEKKCKPIGKTLERKPSTTMALTPIETLEPQALKREPSIAMALTPIEILELPALEHEQSAVMALTPTETSNRWPSRANSTLPWP